MFLNIEELTFLNIEELMFLIICELLVQCCFTTSFKNIFLCEIKLKYLSLQI